MVTAPVRLRRATRAAADAGAFCALFNTLYTRRVDRAYYEWQFFDTPFPAILEFAVSSSGEVIGTYGLQIVDRPSAAGRIAWAIDIMVAPAWQRQGVFRQLAAQAAAAAAPHRPDALAVFANARAAQAHVSGLGWHRARTVRTFTASTADRPGAPDDVEVRPVRVSDVAAFLSEVECRCARYAMKARTPAFLAWRFERSPWYSYELYGAHQAGALRALLVLKTFVDPVTGGRFGDILDVLWVEPAEVAVAALVRRAFERFRALDVPLAATWLGSDSLLHRVARGAGFEETGQEKYLCCRVLDPGCRWMLEPDGWPVSMTDAEVF